MTKTVWAFVHCWSLVWLLQRSIVIIIIIMMYSYCIVLYLSISVALLTHSLSLSEALPTTAIDTVGVYTPKHYRQLLVKDLSKVPTYMAPRAGFEPTTFRSNGVVSTNAPTCPLAYL